MRPHTLREVVERTLIDLRGDRDHHLRELLDAFLGRAGERLSRR